MTKIYLFGCFLGVASIASAQNSDIQEHSPTNFFKNNTKHRTTRAAEAKGDDPTIVYWSEDFSNGMDGQGDNGSWSTDEEFGDLWFVTYPPENEDGYDMSAPLIDASANYGDYLPNWYEGTDILGSTTRDNGLMMLDGDRFNSTATVGDTDNPGGNTTSNSFSAALISPSFDLTGVELAELSYWHSTRFCCAVADYALSVEISVDGGDSWIPYDGYTDYSQFDGESTQINIDITDVLQGATDLSDCRVKFFWNGLQSHYYWMIDDVAIIAPPENDMAAIRGWYGDHHQYSEAMFSEESTITAAEYYDSFEYFVTPDYFYENRPLNFALAVKNNGTQVQTGVKLKVTATAPDETSMSWEDGVAISVEPGESDTIYLPAKFLTELTATLQEGNYSFDYEVLQNEDDERPDDNTGIARGTNIEVETQDNNYFTTYRNGENSYGGSYIEDGQDRIFGTAYVFPYEVESKIITHVETVFLYAEDFAETQAGEYVYFNVREGSVFEEDDEDPETTTTVFFDSENPLFYEDGDLEYEIQNEDIWDNTDGFPFIWTSFELPSPILVEPGKVYQAEFRIPTAGDDIVFNPSPDGEQERFASFMYDPAEGWLFLGENAQPIRFRMSDETTIGIETATFESGITLLQNYPNPFKGETRIQYSLDETQEASIEIHDIAGKLIMAEDLGMVSAGAANTFMLDGSSLSAGVYTYSIVTANTKVTRKLSVQ